MENYSYLKKIGRGSYGEVWLVQLHKNKKRYVLKQISLQNASKRELRAANLEVQLLSSLKHPNIVSYQDSFESVEDGLLYIVMSYCEGGDLFSRLKAQKGVPFAEEQVVRWFIQICMALQYLHDRKILHRDLKTQNVFLTKNNIIKVGDLGIAKILDGDGAMATTLIGTPYYMSPELLANRPYNYKSDVWALGCCIYEVATLRPAFTARDMSSLMSKILRGRLPALPKIYSNELHDLILALLKRNPLKRPSVSRILRHPYIKKNISIFLEGIRICQDGSTESSPNKPESSKSKPEIKKWESKDLFLGIHGIKLSLEKAVSSTSHDVCHGQKKKTRTQLPFGDQVFHKCGPRDGFTAADDTKNYQNLCNGREETLTVDTRTLPADENQPLFIQGQRVKLDERGLCACRGASHRNRHLQQDKRSESPLQQLSEDELLADVQDVSFETVGHPELKGYHFGEKRPDKALKDDFLKLDPGSVKGFNAKTNQQESLRSREINEDLIQCMSAVPNLTMVSEMPAKLPGQQRAQCNSIARQRRRQKLLHQKNEPSAWEMAEISI